ncbi:MAG: GGDEF domain-containing protein [Candidatus Abyssobacteria bacterium SURF_5]|uniref:diguanylate cyclase n=1 Tax=Abyssobacteria bacterium (strain SURF_5) TaxID=2093360 RepID=A0A3A4N779_ABYX5|nr:MAG: GGDEF domain-containing protein [Candidatus Abyssubacteria bacterium SURF_5]
MIQEVQIKKLLMRSSKLPTIPAVARQLLSISEWETADLNQVAEIISADISLVSRILRIVNSPFYGFPHKISTISQALVVLGVRATRSLTLSFSLLQMSSAGGGGKFNYAGFWTRSLNTAVAAREFAQAAGLRDMEEAFVSGLLQDIGVLVIGHCAPREYALISRESPDQLAPPLAVERRHLGTDHVELAKHLFEEWKLPHSLLIPVLYHHEPQGLTSTDPQTMLSINIQYFAGRMGEWLYATHKNGNSFDGLSELALEYFGISQLEFEALMRRIDCRVSEMSELFEVNDTRPTTYANLLEQANQELGRIVHEQERLLRDLEAAKLEAKKLAEQLREANLKLVSESRKDGLTDLANRRHCEEFLDKELKRSLRYGHPISVLFIDIDNFKSINDRWGHLAGDANIKQFAGILKESVRANDLVARYGGEEFLVILVESSSSEAVVAAERIRQAVEQTPFFREDSAVPLFLTASIGIASWMPGDEQIDMRALLGKADEAMYQAKRAGKNCVSVLDANS